MLPQGTELAVTSTSSPARLKEELIACDLHAQKSSASEMTWGEFWPWFMGVAKITSDIPTVFCRFCEGLVQCGLPLWRGALVVEILHPELSGSSLVWTQEEGMIVSREAERMGVARSDFYLNSPARVVDKTGHPFRRHLMEPCPELPILDNLRLAGATDYLMLPLPFLDRTRSAAHSFTTRKPKVSRRHNSTRST